MLVVKDEPRGIRMWAAALYVVGVTIVGFGTWMFGFRTGEPNGRPNCMLCALAAGVLWPVLLLGVIEVVVIRQVADRLAAGSSTRDWPLRGRVEADHTERRENACRITALAASKHEVLAE